jgi:FKBP-type peptidyl-prolyl cis-trans isomerase 2
MQHLLNRLTGAVAIPTLLFCLATGVLHAEEKQVITEGSKVSLEYSLTLEDGEAIDGNTGAGQEPLVYTQGNSEILPALEAELDGLAQGDQKQVTLQPDQAYGEVDPAAFQEVPLEQIPEDARRQGQLLVMQDQQGNRQQIRVSEIREESAVLDLNHPLAGKTLHFDVKIVDVQ